MYKMKQLLMRNLIFFAVAVVYEVQCQPPDLQFFNTPSVCHGSSSTETLLNAECNASSVIAIKEIITGAKPTSSGCPVFYNSTLGFDTCCSKDANDCTFQFNTNYQYHNQCNGLQSCVLGSQQQEIHDNCNMLNVTFGADGRYSHYMFMTYGCVKDDKMVEMCSGQSKSLTKENTEVYVWNKNFPNSGIVSEDSSCNCSIEIDNCQAGVSIYTMYRHLTGDGGGTCNQTLTVVGGQNGTVLEEWSCSDNMLDFETDTVEETYIQLNLENRRNGTGGKFWFGFKATMNSNIIVSCPPVTQQFCISKTSTTTTTTTTESTANTSTTTSIATNTTTTTTTTTLPTPAEVTTPENTTKSSKDETGDGLLVAVIVLGLLVALLSGAVIVLACCLQRICCCAKPEDDVEKEKAKNHQSPPRPSTVVGLKPVSESSPPCTFLIGDIPNKLIDSGCQVSLASLKADTADFCCQAVMTEKKSDQKTYTPPPVQLLDKGIQSVRQPSWAHFQCQTDVVRKKNRKIQINISSNTPIATVSCQTDEIIKKDTNIQPNSQILLNDMAPLTKIMGSGTIPRPTERDEILQKSETTSRYTEIVKEIPKSRYHKKRKKKKRRYESDGEANIDSGFKSPASLESIIPNMKKESPCQSNEDLPVKEEFFDVETRDEVCEDCDGEIRTIHVIPESNTRNIPTEEKHMVSLRNTIAYSFFGKERAEEKMLKLVSRTFKGQKNKKLVKRTSSEC